MLELVIYAGNILSHEELSAIAGIVLTLYFSYIPGLNESYARLLPEAKRAVMLVLLLAVAIGSMTLVCAGEIGEALGVTLVCDKEGAYGLVRVLVIAIIANQSIYAITPKMQKVRIASSRSGD